MPVTISDGHSAMTDEVISLLTEIRDLLLAMQPRKRAAEKRPRYALGDKGRPGASLSAPQIDAIHANLDALKAEPMTVSQYLAEHLGMKPSRNQTVEAMAILRTLGFETFRRKDGRYLVPPAN